MTSENQIIELLLHSDKFKKRTELISLAKQYMSDDVDRIRAYELALEDLDISL